MSVRPNRISPTILLTFTDCTHVRNVNKKHPRTVVFPMICHCTSTFRVKKKKCITSHNSEIHFSKVPNLLGQEQPNTPAWDFVFCCTYVCLKSGYTPGTLCCQSQGSLVKFALKFHLQHFARLG